MFNHNLQSLISQGFIPLTLDTYKNVGHWMFRNEGIKHNISYESLRAFRIDVSETWMIFIDTSKQLKPFEDLALLGNLK